MDSPMQLRLHAAENLIHKKKYGQATKEFCWLWRNILSHEPSMSGVRRSFMAGSMIRLVAVSAHAREQFRQLRSECTPVVDSSGTASPFTPDWIVLNSVVGDDRRTLRYLDSLAGVRHRTKSIRKYPHHLKQLFFARKRWSDVALLYDRPEEYLRWSFNLIEDTRVRLAKSGMHGFDEMLEASAGVFRDEVGMLYASHLLATDDRRARAIEREARAISWNRKTVQRIVQWCKRLRVIRPRHSKWLKELGL